MQPTENTAEAWTTNGTLVASILCVGVAYLLWLYHGFVRACRSVSNHPGPRTLLGHGGNMNLVTDWFLPRMPFVTRGYNYAWEDKHNDYQLAGWDVTAHISAWPSARIMLNVADPNAVKEITSHRYVFPKPTMRYKILETWGTNIVSSEAELWKRYRKISAPAFSDRNNRLVWDETVKIMIDLFDNQWGDKDQVVVDHAVDITLPIALFVIGVAGFGKQMTWATNAVVLDGHSMSFQDALHIASRDMIYKVLVPQWALGLNQRLREVKNGFGELEKYMLEMIESRRSSGKAEERWDLFSALMDASERAEGELPFAINELMSNVFVFLLAGHETSAHTLCYAFGLLAMHPEEQERLHSHIKTVVTNGEIPAYEDMNQLTYSNAVFYETLRLYTPVAYIPKIAAKDAVITVGNSAGETKILPVPEGTELNLSVAGMHYNPTYWENPHEFRPSRFLKPDWPRDAFIPFSVGHRACLGRKFFETEAIATLTMLMLRYKVTIKEEPEFGGETYQERRDRIFASKKGVTLTPKRVPLVFTRR